MMKAIRALAGTVAVIFSIQPLLSWAVQEATASDKGIDVMKVQKATIVKTGDRDAKEGGSPTCGFYK